jgi:hypothetical protein
MDGLIDEVEHEHPRICPPDLEMRPYIEGAPELLEEVRAGQKRVEASKMSKDAVTRKLKPIDDEVAHTPFSWDAQALDKLRPDQTPRFFGAMTDPEGCETRTVRLNNLHAMQNRVNSAKAEAMRAQLAEGKSLGDKLPVVVRYSGKNYIGDGHHRLAAQWLNGENTAEVAYKDLSSFDNAVKVADDWDLAKWDEDKAIKNYLGTQKFAKYDASEWRDAKGRWSAGSVSDAPHTNTYGGPHVSTDSTPWFPRQRADTFAERFGDEDYMSAPGKMQFQEHDPDPTNNLLPYTSRQHFEDWTGKPIETFTPHLAEHLEDERNIGTPNSGQVAAADELPDDEELLLEGDPAPLAIAAMAKFDPEEPRDDHGRWTGGASESRLRAFINRAKPTQEEWDAIKHKLSREQLAQVARSPQTWALVGATGVISAALIAVGQPGMILHAAGWGWWAVDLAHYYHSWMHRHDDVAATKAARQITQPDVDAFLEGRTDAERQQFADALIRGLSDEAKADMLQWIVESDGEEVTKADTVSQATGLLWYDQTSAANRDDDMDDLDGGWNASADGDWADDGFNVAKYSPQQARDERGRWTVGGEFEPGFIHQNTLYMLEGKTVSLARKRNWAWNVVRRVATTLAVGVALGALGTAFLPTWAAAAVAGTGMLLATPVADATMEALRPTITDLRIGRQTTYNTPPVSVINTPNVNIRNPDDILLPRKDQLLLPSKMVKAKGHLTIQQIDEILSLFDEHQKQLIVDHMSHLSPEELILVAHDLAPEEVTGTGKVAKAADGRDEDQPRGDEQGKVDPSRARAAEQLANSDKPFFSDQYDHPDLKAAIEQRWALMPPDDRKVVAYHMLGGRHV